MTVFAGGYGGDIPPTQPDVDNWIEILAIPHGPAGDGNPLVTPVPGVSLGETDTTIAATDAVSPQGVEIKVDTITNEQCYTTG
jgi:hypothetical protein